MKSLKLYIPFIIILALWSCEKEIEVDVDDASARLIIDARLSTNAGETEVVLTQSLPLNSTATPPNVSDAEININVLETGEIFRFNEIEPGIYQNPNLLGEEGFTYTLEVTLPDGTSYTSTQTMPEATILNDVAYEYFDFSFGDDDEEYYEIIPKFIDSEGEDDFYQVEIIRNNRLLNDLHIFKDLGFDGLENTQRIFLEAYPMDTLQARLFNVTESGYEYLLGLENNINQSSATPTNPISNISGGALGFFKVYATSNPITIIIQEDNE